MRGEEVQFLGAVEAGLVPGDALLVQPGTHCKWAEMAGGRVAGFTTAMTGELFALLRTHGLLAAQLGGAVRRARHSSTASRKGASGPRRLAVRHPRREAARRSATTRMPRASPAAC
jgi:2-dehydro-3-deoxygalactonokinase